MIWSSCRCVDGGPLKGLTELDYIGGVVHLTPLYDTSSPSKDGGNGVRRGLLPLLVASVVS